MAETVTSTWPIPRVWRMDEVLVRFVTAACWNAASVGLARVFNTASLLIAARVLGPTQYGALGVTQNTVAMLGVFAGFGLGMTATKLVAQHRRMNPARAGETIAGLQGIALTGGLLAALAALCGGPLIAEWILSSAELGPILQLASILLVLNAVQGVQQGAFAGLENVRAMAAVQALGGLTLVCLMYFGASWGGVRGCLIIQIATTLLQVAVGQFMLRHVAAEHAIAVGWPKFRWSLPEFTEFGLPAALSAMMVIPVEWLGSVMLVNRPDGYVEMGLYAAAWQWVTPLLLVPTVVGQSILPLFGERHAAGDRTAPLRLLAAGMAMNAAVVVPLALAGVLCSSTLLGLSGPAFLEGESALRLLFAAAAIYAVEVPLGLFLAGQGWIWPAFAANLGWALCLLAGVAGLVAYGAQGVALARLLSYVGHGLWLMVLVWRLQRSLNRHAHVST